MFKYKNYESNKEEFKLNALNCINILNSKISSKQKELDLLFDKKKALDKKTKCDHNIDHGVCTRCDWNVKQIAPRIDEI